MRLPITGICVSVASAVAGTMPDTCEAPNT